MIAYLRAQTRALRALSLAAITGALGLLALAAPNPAPGWLVASLASLHALSLGWAVGATYRAERLFRRASSPRLPPGFR